MALSPSGYRMHAIADKAFRSSFGPPTGELVMQPLHNQKDPNPMTDETQAIATSDHAAVTALEAATQPGMAQPTLALTADDVSALRAVLAWTVEHCPNGIPMDPEIRKGLVALKAAEDVRARLDAFAGASA